MTLEESEGTNAMPSASNTNTPKKPRDQDAAFVEADIISNLRLTADFAELAERHAAIFDDDGFRYCVDRFLDHARLVSTNIKKLRGMD
jgi:hypothetical protein